MKALILVDLQNDFCPGGALAVPGGDEVIPLANQLQPHFDLVLATQDWHPPDHFSFAANHAGHAPGDVITVDGLTQILWPIHCVQESRGAELHADLSCESIARIFRKGVDSRVDSYSTFFDNAKRRQTGLADYLRDRDVTDVFLCGLATDYCVKFSALDAIELGFQTHVIVDACRGVHLRSDDVTDALAAMQAAGVDLVHSRQFLPSTADDD